MARETTVPLRRGWTTGACAAAAARAAGGDGSVAHLALDDARARLGPFADALACDLNVDSSKATRELGWEPHRPTLLEELSNTTVV